MPTPRSRRALLALALGGLVAALAASSFMPARVADETRSGWLNLVWQTSGVHNQLVHVGMYLVDDQGNGTELEATPQQLQAWGGMLRLNGRRLTVSGELLTPGAARATPLLRVRSLREASGGPRLSVGYSTQTGDRPYLLILCRFADQPNSDAQPAGVYAAWTNGSYPGIGHFWGENSEQQVTIHTTVVGPFVLPQPGTYYVKNNAADLGTLARDCTGAADASVDFSQYAGIEMQFNSDLQNSSWGGSWTATLDGVTRRWPATWMARWATPATYAHETGHSLGLPHSSGPYSATYDSRWDVMSGGGALDVSVGTWVPPQTIAFHKDLLGWISPARKYVAGPGTSAVLELARSALPGSDGYEMVQIPIGGSSSVFYTVEGRRFAGYDGPTRLPGEAVLIHRVNINDLVPAKVVDPDGNFDPNDAGAMWTPGETFTDLTNGVEVRVLAATAGGFQVQVSTAGGLGVQLDSVLRPGTMGSDYAVQLGPLPGSGAATWTVLSGTLPRGLALTSDGRVVGVPAEAGTFRFVVNVVQSGGFATRELRLQVDKPALAEAAVLDQLLGTGTLSSDQQRFLDLLGNGNGRLDVGDVRAWLQDQGVAVGGTRPGG